jgi:phenylalanyl-tRNA synthetase beta chain
MKVLLSWLREMVPLEGDPVALGEVMSDLGMAVEALDRLGGGLDGIVVARVLETRPIEGAKKIHQVIVDAGDGEGLEVGCGAFNMAPGDLVPLATVGTTMPNGMEIGRRKMAGVVSNGMLCSSRELGLGDDHAGIMILPRTSGPAPRSRRRWASRPTRSATSSRSTPTGPTPCPSPASRATSRPASACPSSSPSPP